MKNVLPNLDDNQRMDLIRQQNKPVFINPLLKNPKKYRMILRSEFDEDVRVNIPSELLLKHSLEKQGRELTALPVAPKYRWVLSNGDNAAIIAKYLSDVLKNKFGKRDDWKIDDYQYARKELTNIIEHLNKMIISIL